MISLKSDTEVGGIDKPQAIPVPDYIAGHLLWEAMRDFRVAYGDLTEVCHAAAERLKTPSFDDRLAVSILVKQSLPQVERLAEALKRANLFAYGEVYDELIVCEELAPRKVKR